MSKRLAAPAGDTPAAKRPCAATPATTQAPTNSSRVELDVGGTRFVSSRSSLEAASEYFRSLLGRWDQQAAEPIFLDCDADAFQVLLSYMRVATCVLLPQHDEGLATRVLLLAEYLGLDGFLAQVKARAYANMHLDAEEAVEDPAAKFDEEVGGLQQAIDCGVLPARFFAPEPPKPEPPERTVKAFVPQSGYKVVFADDEIDTADVHGLHSRPVLGFALVELKSGRQIVDVVIQNESDGTYGDVAVDARDEESWSHLTFASEYAKTVPWEHWLAVRTAAADMLPIPTGSVRGVWSKPALTEADVGKQATFRRSSITVGGNERPVNWDGDLPEGGLLGSSGTIIGVADFVGGHVGVMMDGRRKVLKNPLSATQDNQLQVNLAFAKVEPAVDEGSLSTRFFMPVCTTSGDGRKVELCDAQTTSIGAMRFSHFISS